MISIKKNIESELVSLEYNMEKTNSVLLADIKNMIYQTVTKKYTEQFIKRQRRINVIKSPFKKVRNILQDVIGENIESLKAEEMMDTTLLEEEKSVTREILNSISYTDCLDFLKYSNKHGLKKANNTWRTLS